MLHRGLKTRLRMCALFEINVYMQFVLVLVPLKNLTVRRQLEKEKKFAASETVLNEKTSHF